MIVTSSSSVNGRYTLDGESGMTSSDREIQKLENYYYCGELVNASVELKADPVAIHIKQMCSLFTTLTKERWETWHRKFGTYVLEAIGVENRLTCFALYDLGLEEKDFHYDDSEPGCLIFTCNKTINDFTEFLKGKFSISQEEFEDERYAKFFEQKFSLPAEERLALVEEREDGVTILKNLSSPSNPEIPFRLLFSQETLDNGGRRIKILIDPLET